jgi:hypothetical protein
MKQSKIIDTCATYHIPKYRMLCWRPHTTVPAPLPVETLLATIVFPCRLSHVCRHGTSALRQPRPILLQLQRSTHCCPCFPPIPGGSCHRLHWPSLLPCLGVPSTNDAPNWQWVLPVMVDLTQDDDEQ